jgi:flavin-dependent dehydrogenase
MYDIAIIGGGVAGLYLANLIEKKNVLLIEEHEKLGPKRCSGIVSERINKLLDFPKYLIEKKLDSAILKCGDTSVEIKIDSLVLNKEGFENYLLKKAKRNVNVIFERVTDIIEGSGALIKTKKNIYRSKYIVGCDGPNSIVRKIFVGKEPKKFYFGKFCYSKERPSNYHEIFFDSKYSDLFSWITPKRNFVEYGLICEKNLNKNYNLFINDKKPEIIEESFGVIPVGILNCSFSKGVLIGNAAAQTKPLTGGGIIYSMVASRIAAEELNKENPNFLRYENKCKKLFGDEIKSQLRFRLFYSKLSDRRKQKLLKSLVRENPKIDMDFPMKSILKGKKLNIFKHLIHSLP